MQHKAIIIILFIFLILPKGADANNIQVRNGPVIDTLSIDVIPGYCAIEFEVSWDNSWRLPDRSNWDAAWIFCKANARCFGGWKHGYWHENPSTHSILSSSDPLELRISEDRTGALLFRKDTGSGSVQAKMRMWFEYPDGISCNMKTDTVQVSVFAIEMVHIPADTFQLGDTKNSRTLYCKSKNINVGADISSEVISGADGYSFDGKALPEGYPTGYNAFYLMKYEITQHAYVDFINTLSYLEQERRTAVAPSSAPGTFAMVTLASPEQYRNFIRVRFSGNDYSGVSATYGNSVDMSSWDREENGGNIACNFLSWEDLLAYADWAGLRPHTELEFEKACRGSKRRGAMGDFAWGSASVNYMVKVKNLWFKNENKADEIAVDPASINPWFFYFNALKIDEAPWVMRVGAFANSESGRSMAGAGYYGNMNLSDNLWDRCVSVESAEGRLFTGMHGNGVLSPVVAGDCDVAGWSKSYTASILRGFEISNRTATNQNGRYRAAGGRLARTVSTALTD